MTQDEIFRIYSGRFLLFALYTGNLMEVKDILQ
jgi:hypothetical protein